MVTEYVFNDWILSSYIYGPHGWCHSDGTIFFGDNIGKWPSGMAVYRDWCFLANKFPFLNLDVTLMDREYCEDNPQPVMSFRVRNGAVDVVEPTAEGLHSHQRPKPRDNVFDYAMNRGPLLRTNSCVSPHCALTAKDLLAIAQHYENLPRIAEAETAAKLDTNQWRKDREAAVRWLYNLTFRR